MAVASVTATSVLGGNVRSTFPPCHANLVILAADNPAAAVLITGKTNYTIHVTHISISVTTTAAQSIDIQDGAGTPIEVLGLPASAVEGCYVWTFGEEGIPLTEGKDLTITTSAAGVACYVHVEGYFRQTSTQTAAQLASA
jgi:hypothetical protein